MERKIPVKLPAAQGPQNMKEGEDEIEVGGKKLKCKTREFEKKLASGKTGTLNSGSTTTSRDGREGRNEQPGDPEDHHDRVGVEKK
jgi:hypothetical protein